MWEEKKATSLQLRKLNRDRQQSRIRCRLKMISDKVMSSGKY